MNTKPKNPHKISSAPTATVFIPTYNGGEYLTQLLDAVFTQKNVTFEVLIIDSGSKDNTLSIIKKYPKAHLHQIPNSEFGHGKTRNLAAQMSRGEFIVYLSQDAVPAHDRWLEFMIEPFFISEQVYCVFGRQIPRPFADAPTKREVSGVFNSLGPEHSIMLHRKDSLVSSIDANAALTFMSDVNSAVRREYLLNIIPYRDVRYSEDQLLGKDVLDAGYLKAYSSKGSVMHSNEYGIRDYFRRKYDEYMGMYEVLGVLPPASRKYQLKWFIKTTLQDYIFITRDKDYGLRAKIRNFVSSPARNFLRARAALLVSNEEYRTKHGLKHSLEGNKKSIET